MTDYVVHGSNRAHLRHLHLRRHRPSQDMPTTIALIGVVAGTSLLPRHPPRRPLPQGHLLQLLRRLPCRPQRVVVDLYARTTAPDLHRRRAAMSRTVHICSAWRSRWFQRAPTAPSELPDLRYSGMLGVIGISASPTGSWLRTRPAAPQPRRRCPHLGSEHLLRRRRQQPGVLYPEHGGLEGILEEGGDSSSFIWGATSSTTLSAAGRRPYRRAAPAIIHRRRIRTQHDPEQHRNNIIDPDMKISSGVRTIPATIRRAT